MRSNGISVISNRRHISLPVEDILYIQLAGRRAVIHASGGRTYETYTTIEELEQMLGSGFIRTDRATLVAAKGIHAIGRQISSSSTVKRWTTPTGESGSSRNSCAPIGGRSRRTCPTATRLPRGKTISGIMPAMTAHPLHLPTSRWSSTRSAPPWTGYSATPTRRWRGWKKTAGAAHRPLLQQHFSQYGRQVAAGLRAHSAVRRNAGDHRSQPGDRHGSEDHLLPHLQGTLRLHPLQAGGNSNDAC